jgi:hypothetical protein
MVINKTKLFVRIKSHKDICKIIYQYGDIHSKGGDGPTNQNLRFFDDQVLIDLIYLENLFFHFFNKYIM